MNKQSKRPTDNKATQSGQTTDEAEKVPLKRQVRADALLDYARDNFYSKNHLALEGMNLFELRRAGWSMANIMQAAEDLVNQGRATLTNSRCVFMVDPIDKDDEQ